MILQTILAQLAPHDCLGCRAEGALLCATCASQLATTPERCYRCHSRQTTDRACSACLAASGLTSLRSVTAYRGLAKDLIWRLKSSGAQAAAREMAALMTPLLLADPDIVIVPIPTATTRVRQRGYDQAVLLARAIAQKSGTRYAPSLRRLGQHHQVGANRAQRVTQLAEAYRCIHPTLVAGAHVVLIDDVLTTGASLEAAAQVLLTAGAANVSGLTFAQA